MKTDYKIKNLIHNFISIVSLFGINKILVLTSLIIIIIFLEVLSIGLIIPIISILENKDFLNNLFNNINFIPEMTHLEQIISILLFLCFVFLVKFLFLIFANYKQFKYSMELQSYMSNKLIKKYLTMPYENHFQLKTSEILRNVKEETGSFVHGVLIPVINITTEVLVIIGITILLVSQIGLASFSIIILFTLFCWFYIKFSKKRIQKLGNDRFVIDEKIINTSNEAFSGIREIKVNRVESLFQNYFQSLFNRNAENTRKFLTFQQVPRLLIETLLVFFLSFLMFVLVFQEMIFSKIIVILGLFCISAIRLIPSTNKIMLAQQNIRFYFVSINNLAKELFYKKSNKEKKTIEFSKDIKLSNIKFSYVKKNLKVLDNLKLTINKGDRIAIIGQTGSGKSTLVDIISGLIPSFDGKYIVDNKKINFNEYSWKKKIGYVSQNTFIFNDTIRFNISFDNSVKKSEILKVLDQVESLKFVKKLHKSINTIVGEKAISLSGGQSQRLGIARSLFYKPDLLILDEAFSGIDDHTETKIVKKIFNNYKNMTIINIAHKGKSLDYCNKIFKLSNRKLIRLK
jgi:ABC-type bacteriocin/lantibiotic exporter with double-glycine peptidase domain